MKNFTNIEKGALALIILALIGVGIYYLLQYLDIGGIKGCMDKNATNYEPGATKDDGSCKYDCSRNTMGKIEIKKIASIAGSPIITTTLPIPAFKSILGYGPTSICFNTSNGQFTYDILSYVLNTVTLVSGQTLDSSITAGTFFDFHA